MALSIKTEEADRLARELAALTGETLTDAVTNALRERLARERDVQRAEYVERLMAFAESVATKYDRRPVTKAEWDWASGDED
ncbi:type II toxin-antitoxin system VapB family antitoxin [Caulobacter mirabilis]|uniref:Transcription factor n=1 Tax=Caulobacter mirabilis TaxID=69666 RepID=A0A2D2AUR0_9CAUL|nr:type II toxin-antitoxin system VapB family antitoxin [Caulobacter mirabilis]ATQ41736.1 transcription factor [Caulobacter mirabilis]